MNDKQLPVVFENLEHTQENIRKVLEADPRNIDAAIAILGEVGFFERNDSPTNIKLYQFVTGMNQNTGQQQWMPKSLRHPNSDKVFRYDCSITGKESALELGFQIANDGWLDLKPLLEKGYIPPDLRTKRTPRKQKTIDLQGVRIDALKGKAVKFVLNGGYYWVPRSIVKYSYEDETLTVPQWYAKQKKLL
jgi:hypothetical protein|tara:strand:- start:844 stop:1416 length:573 start_codon:yes stop_codon:yes gene_type:complete